MKEMPKVFLLIELLSHVRRNLLEPMVSSGNGAILYLSVIPSFLKIRKILNFHANFVFSSAVDFSCKITEGFYINVNIFIRSKDPACISLPVSFSSTLPRRPVHCWIPSM